MGKQIGASIEFAVADVCVAKAQSNSVGKFCAYLLEQSCNCFFPGIVGARTCPLIERRRQPLRLFRRNETVISHRGWPASSAGRRCGKRISFSPKSRSAMIPRLRQSSISRFDSTMGLDVSVYFTLIT